jgi:hypothetical protein
MKNGVVEDSSPKWDFHDAPFDRTAASLNDPDHQYRDP